MPHRGIAGRTFLKIVDRQRVNLTSADIPGPQVPQYFAGARLVEVFPMAPLIGKVSLAVAAMSYAGQFNITVIADRDTYLDLDVFVAGVQEELQALAAAMSAEPRPAPGFP
jgi:diacylglycerol O-acyltransferase